MHLLDVALGGKMLRGLQMLLLLGQHDLLLLLLQMDVLLLLNHRVPVVGSLVEEIQLEVKQPHQIARTFFSRGREPLLLLLNELLLLLNKLLLLLHRLDHSGFLRSSSANERRGFLRRHFR